MQSFKAFLSESKEGKNLHMEHLEDLILNDGIVGTRNAINFLQSLRDMLAGHGERRVNITTKWDGAPAIFAGINPENKKFFVGTKGVFAQNAKLNYTDEDIDKNHPGEGLNRKLKIALRFLPELGIKGVLQGDMLYTKDDIKKDEIDGEKYITFTPNTITYAIPSDSALAKIILGTQMGVVFHTTYAGKTMADMQASFGADVGYLKQSKHVWFRDASFTDATGSATFTETETAALTAVLSELGSLFRQVQAPVINHIAISETLKIQIKAFNNSKVRAGEKITNTRAHVIGLIQHIEDKANKEIAAAKREDTKRNRQLEKKELLSFFRGNAAQLKLILDIQNLIVEAKEMIIRKLESVRDIGTFLRTDDGFKVTPVEGFVAIDRLKGNAIKLVDRLTFSTANFNVTKSWSK